MAASKLATLLLRAIAAQSSDLHLTPGYPPMVRVHGIIQPLPGYAVVQHEDCVELLSEVTSADQRKRLERDKSLDFTWGLDTNRFRTNAAMTWAGLEIVCRIIPMHIPTSDEIGLPKAIVDMADIPRGLVLVTGPAGAGKSTTLACLLNIINHKRPAHIVTVEDPIEFVYPPMRSVITQREVGPHAPTFERALRDVLRQDPDVVMIGEMRDLETIAAAITVAETGHLVFATMHSYDAPQAVDRIIDVFPARQQQQVRIQLAGVLRAVVAQTLVPAKNGTRVAAREILLINQAVSTLIRQSRTHEIPSAMEMGMSQGMLSMERSLQELVRTNQVDAAILSKGRSPSI